MQPDLCIYEDAEIDNLYPLSLTRPAFDLRSGIFSLKEKIVRHFPGSRLHYLVRPELQPILEAKTGSTNIHLAPEKNAYFINSRFIPDMALPTNLKRSTVFLADGTIAGAFILGRDRKKKVIIENGMLDVHQFEKLKRVELSGRWIKYLWDLVNNCASEITADFMFMQYGGRLLGSIYTNAVMLNKQNIYIAPGAIVQPGVVLDAEKGPIYISDGANIMANSVILGPVYIGVNTIVRSGARIYGGTSIGQVCKVAGEIENSIIQAYSNKPHEGFLGNAYLGEWVNLGADTNNSNLKNNYSEIRVQLNGKTVNSKSIFAGLFMGDHAKCGINTMFNTGVTVGVMANVFGSGFTPKFIPSFAWGGIQKTDKFQFDKAISAAKVAMSRRKRELSQVEIELLKRIYDNTVIEQV